MLNKCRNEYNHLLLSSESVSSCVLSKKRDFIISLFFNCTGDRQLNCYNCSFSDVEIYIAFLSIFRDIS